jgi:hypothetical protein
VVLPKIHGLSTPGGKERMMGAIPLEAGSVAPLSGGSTLGMGFNIDIGLPEARNNMEVASLYDREGGGGVFFADVDGDLDNGTAPLQFVLTADDMVGFWIGDIAAHSQVSLSGLAIGIHHSGDWHEAVDYYVSVHRPRWHFPDTPPWFRDAGAIYSFTGGGAGGIYLSFPSVSLADGAVWDTWEENDSAWRDGGKDGLNGVPVQISAAGFASAGSLLVAEQQNSQQVDVFAVGADGAIWVTWESKDGPWRDGRAGRAPERATPPDLALPGSPIAAVRAAADELDVFVVGRNGAIWRTWERGDSAWRDGNDGRQPQQVSPSGFAGLGSHLAAARQNDTQLDVFVIRPDGEARILRACQRRRPARRASGRTLCREPAARKRRKPGDVRESQPLSVLARDAGLPRARDGILRLWRAWPREPGGVAVQPV